NNDENASFTIEDVSGSELTRNLGIYGSSDMVGSIAVLRNALHNNDPEAIGMLLENMDDAIKHLLSVRATVGSCSFSLETTAARLENQKLIFTKLLSEVEDADITKVLTELTTLENNYQVSLMATAKIIQPTLLNFLK
ncbi:MAG: flagellin, partial [candidate division Zixibacteria bacterium]|nr:flagellin [candidate division Zixibacteria bacterium]